MESFLKKALNQVTADEDLKRRTKEFLLNSDTNVVSIHSAASKRPVYMKRLVAAACAAAVICVLPIGAYAYYQTPTSYVSVDINPSIELGINAFGNVVSVKAYNTDGETVIDGLTLLHSNVESAVRLIVKSASDNGFIKEDGSSFISVVAETNSEKKAEILKQDAQAGAEDAIESENESATIETDIVALDLRDQAISLGITPGKLNLIQKLQAFDPTIKTETYKDASVSEIQKKFTELKKEHNGKNEGDPTPSPSPSSSPTPSTSASPDNSSKPGNGNHNGNGKENNNAPDPGTSTGGSGSETPGTSTSPGESTHGNGNKGDDNHSKGNGYNGKDDGHNGKDGGYYGKDNGNDGKGH